VEEQQYNSATVCLVVGAILPFQTALNAFQITMVLTVTSSVGPVMIAVAITFAMLMAPEHAYHTILGCQTV